MFAFATELDKKWVSFMEVDEKPIKQDVARYFGGHLKYPLKSGRFFDMGDTTKTGVDGWLRLSHDRIEFEKSALRQSKRWKIIIKMEDNHSIRKHFSSTCC